eukprot:c20854_g2_i1 orf=175-399(+)
MTLPQESSPHSPESKSYEEERLWNEVATGESLRQERWSSLQRKRASKKRRSTHCYSATSFHTCSEEKKLTLKTE